MDSGKIGFKDDKDSILISPVYDFYEPAQAKHGWSVTGQGSYERLNNNASDRAVKFTGKFGFIEVSGKEIFKPQFDMVFKVFEDYAIVGQGEGYLKYNDWPEGKSISFSGKMGVINIQGSVIVPFNFNDIKLVRSSDLSYWFTLDDQGRSYLYKDSILLSIPENTTSISDFSQGLAKIEVNQKFGFIDTLGKAAIQPVYDKAKDFKEGKVFVKLKDRYLWLDRFSNEIENEKDLVFDYVGNYSDGYALVKVFDEYGFIGPDSSFFKSPRFTDATPFFNQISSVSSIDSFGYVFTSGIEDIVGKYEKNEIKVSSNLFNGEKLQDFKFPVTGTYDTSNFYTSFDTLTLDKLFSIQIEALRWAPYLYFTYPQMLPKVSAGEGTLAGRYLFNVSFLKPGNEIWEKIKKTILLPLLTEEKSRILIWKLVKPFYKSTFQSMPELHQQVYLDMLNYLEKYFNNYNIEKTKEFLVNNESFFAHEHPDGTLSPYRKTSAQIERMILIYQVISIDDVQKWIRKINRDVNKW
jgi:hypothetical protein